MGGSPGEEPLLLRRSHHLGPAERGLPPDPGAHPAHERPLLHLRVSSLNYELFTFEIFLLIKPFQCPSCPFLVQHLTSCIPAIGGVLFLFVLLTLLRTSFSDPGILPRATPDEAAQVERQIGKLREVSGGFRKGVCVRPGGLVLRRQLWQRRLPAPTANPGGARQPAGGEAQVLLHLQDVPAPADFPLQPM